MEINSREQELLQKYLDNKCSPAELEELFAYLKAGNDAAYEKVMEDLWHQISAEKILDGKKADHLLEKVIQKERPAVYRYRKWYYLAAAAVLLAAIASGLMLFVSLKKPLTPAIVRTKINSYPSTIQPGGTKAILQAGNTQIILDKNDTSFTLAGNTVQVNNGNLKASDLKSVEYSLKVPRGGKYSLVLADGTKVWLNADSKLVYPSLFNGNSREVKLEGEAYFEVAHENKRPFIVHILNSKGFDKGRVKVLGTHFNINAYDCDTANIKTTLLKGSVKVSQGSHSIILSPGQQSLMNGKGTIHLRKNVNTREIIAWKNGLFDFEGTDIREVMQQIARWYDVDVQYESIPSAHFVGRISRDADLTKVLKMLELTRTVHFKIIGKTITVLH